MAAAAEQFSCPVCFNGFDKDVRSPLILSCGHTHCQQCLQRLPLPRECPVCRAPIRQSINTLSKNWALMNAMEASHSDLMHILERLDLEEGVRLLVGANEVELLNVLSSEGASGLVYKARFRGREVAVKTYDIATDEGSAAENARREIAVLLRTTHECRHIVKCLGITVKHHKLSVIMKLYDRSLKQRINNTPVPLTAALRYSCDIAKAMIELHRLGVVINDLKPDNVLLDDTTDEAVLTDFGISRIVLTTFAGYRSQSTQGTFPYMAPEQFEPSAHPGVTHKADIWGFGCTLLHMLTGGLPWQGLAKSQMDFVSKVGFRKEHPPIPEALPPALKDMLQRCFCPEPMTRPSAAELYQDLLSMTSAPLPQLPNMSKDSTGGSFKQMQQYVTEVVAQLREVVGDYSGQLQAVRHDGAHQASLLAEIRSQVSSLQQAVETVAAVGGVGARPQLQSICSSKMSDAVVDLRLGLPNTGDDTLDSKLQRLTEGLTSSTSLAHDSPTFSEAAAWPLGAAIMLAPSLQRVELSGAPLGDACCRPLAEALLSNPPLGYLRLEACGIGPVGANLLARSLRHNTTLKELVLTGNQIGSEGVSSFASVLTVNPHLASLTLNRNTLTDASQLGTLLAHPSCRLTHLSLASNALQSWDWLAPALAANTSLTSLQLPYCSLDAAGMIAVADGLASNDTLRALNLSYNRFGLNGAAHVSRALDKNHALQELQLAGCGLGDKGIAVLATSLVLNRGLERLKVDGNQICEQGAKLLAEALPQNQNLVFLSLFDNMIGDKGAQLVGAAAAACAGLKHLVLRNNRVGQGTARMLKGMAPAGVRLEVGA